MLVPVVLSGQNLQLRLFLWLFIVQNQLDTATCECLCVCVLVWVSRKVSGTVLAPCDTTRTLRGKKVKVSPGSTFIFSASENMTYDGSIVQFKCVLFLNIDRWSGDLFFFCILTLVLFIKDELVWTSTKKQVEAFTQNSVKGKRDRVPSFYWWQYSL